MVNGELLFKIKRVYDEPSAEDGYRILIDRLWPRGMSKEKAKLDFWMKDIAPSDKLRQWYGHDPEKWEVFKKKYAKELSTKDELLNQIILIEKEKGTVTLVYSSKEKELNNAVALKAMLEKAG